MGRKAKYTFEQKLQAVLDYQSGKKSAADIALELDMGKCGDNRIRQWTNLYQANGPEALNPKENNSSYSKEFKELVVLDHIQNGLSDKELAAKYNISSTSVIRTWIKRYNNHMEQRDYDPHPEVYMAERKQRKKNEWRSFNTVSIMIAIIKKQLQNMAAAIHRYIHGSVNMTSKEPMAWMTTAAIAKQKKILRIKKNLKEKTND